MRAFVQHQDQVGALHGAQAVGDDKVVRPCITRSSASWIRCSVSLSTLEVASSRIRMRVGQQGAQSPGAAFAHQRA
jgi:hypothetical protein